MLKIKKTVASVLVYVILFSALWTTSIRTRAVSYNRTAALNYASAHWNDGVGECTTFVSACLTAGGISTTISSATSLYNWLVNNGYGTGYKLTANSTGILLSSNSGKVEAGDPVFLVCPVCNTKKHVVLCNGTNSSGYLVDYAHNEPHDGSRKTYPAAYSCSCNGTANTCTAYSVHITAHSHNYTRAYEAAHPHRVYMKCDCGDYYYTGETQDVSTCCFCHPVDRAYLQSDKQTYLSGETACLSWSAATNATRYILDAYCNGTEVCYQDYVTPLSFNLANLSVGEYTVYLYCYDMTRFNPSTNDMSGYIETINFTVTPHDYIPSDSIHSGNKLYMRFDSPVCWKSAESIAIGMGGHLASINNAEEQTAISSLITEGERSAYLLGGNDITAEGVWTWSNGSEWSYLNWFDGEPNNYSGLENCLCIDKSGFRWYDVPEIDSYGFIVEINFSTITAIARTTHRNSTYFLFDTNISWYAAQEYCKSIGGNLACITSAEENQAVSLLTDGHASERYFLGANDAENENEWNWISRENFIYNNWIDGQPDNTQDCENYLTVYRVGTTHGCQWNDISSYYNSTGFICEIERNYTPSTPSAPKIQLIGSTKLTLKPTNGYEYSFDGDNWQASNTFSNLLPDFEYTFYQRVAETTKAFASQSSVGTTTVINGTDALSTPYTALHLVWIRKKLLFASISMAIDINGDGLADIRDLVQIKKIISQ